MKQILLYFILINIIFCYSKNPKQDMHHKFTNKLINETSPYLLQHAHNPVNWYAWNKTTLDRAKSENKPIIVSIGYSACHWCHVMEKESFEDSTIAKIMNDNFICIKVDREEMPNIDDIYMNACNLISGNGGWPLNAFCMPDGRPFYAGTYYRPDDWKEVLLQISDIFDKNPNKLLETAIQVQNGIKNINTIDINNTKIDNDINFNKLFTLMSQNFDLKNGGFNGAPKFIMPDIWEYLIRYYEVSNNQKAIDHTIFTFNQIINGGIYDPIGGGFCRYSTDMKWFAPHFEKMLYDNAQLIKIYSLAYNHNTNERYKSIIYKTIEYLDKNLKNKKGAYYSAQDADSEGEEGKFYVWTKKEIDNILGDNSNIFCDYYNINSKGNWENSNNILYINDKYNTDYYLEKYNINIDKFNDIIDNSIYLLQKDRNKRTKPNIDDKILIDWNSLLISGLCKAYNSFWDKNILDKALGIMQFIDKNMIDKNLQIKRTFKNNLTKIDGLLIDYATVIQANIDLFESTFDIKWLEKANKLCESTIERFDTDNKIMFYTEQNIFSNSISKLIDVNDNVIASGNSIMAMNLYRLGIYYDNTNYISRSRNMYLNMYDNITKNPQYYSNWLSVALLHQNSPKEIVIIGENANDYYNNLKSIKTPNCLFVISDKNEYLPILKNRYINNKTMIYICENNVCKKPFDNITDAINELIYINK